MTISPDWKTSGSELYTQMHAVCGAQTTWALRHRGQMLRSVAAHLQHLNRAQFSSASLIGTPGNAANTFDLPHADALCDVEHFKTFMDLLQAKFNWRLHRQSEMCGSKCLKAEHCT